tara:strand:- start:5416 stop:6045 length:630 start_codon:yes stop_codon:yes gene_type:complete
MSVFRVKLNNIGQGDMDLDPGTAVANVPTGQGLGVQMGDTSAGSSESSSLQRSVYVMGPNKINRLLADGDTFTDCNYWKRFAYPQVPYNEAIVEVVTDDGSVYSDVPGENVFPVVYDRTISFGDTYGDNEIDLGGTAVFVQIANTGAEDIKVRLNGSTSATFDLAAGTEQIFNAGDMSVSLLQFDHNASGGAADVTVQVIASVKSVCTS